MAKGKSDPRKVTGAIVHTKCMNVTENANECRRFFGGQYKTRYTKGIVQSVRIDKTKAGRNQTWLTVKFLCGGVKKVTRDLLISKVYKGPVPGLPTPPPDPQIVTPAKVTAFNYNDNTDGS